MQGTGQPTSTVGGDWALAELHKPLNTIGKTVSVPLLLYLVYHHF